jgi:hypothetical protein
MIHPPTISLGPLDLASDRTQPDLTRTAPDRVLDHQTCDARPRPQPPGPPQEGRSVTIALVAVPGH